MSAARVFSLVFLAIFGWCLAGGVGPGRVQAQGKAPRAEIDQTTFDFGEGYQGRTLTHTFIIKNTGKARLKIKNVDPDCACTSPHYDEVIGAGKEGQITLTIAPFAALGHFLKRTTVSLNDPEAREVVLVLKGNNKPFVEFQPGHIVRFTGKAGQELKEQLKVISHLKTPWEIKEVRLTMWEVKEGARTKLPDMVQVKLSAAEAGQVYVLDAVCKAPKPGQYVGMIELFTSLKQRPRLVVRVFADIQPAGLP